MNVSYDKLTGLQNVTISATVPVHTVAALKALLAVLPDDMPISASGPSWGGYECEDGSNVFAEVKGGALFLQHKV